MPSDESAEGDRRGQLTDGHQQLYLLLFILAVCVGTLVVVRYV